MATKPDRWYFSREQLLNSPSIKCGLDPEKELSYRQQAANLIQDMGQRLQVFQLCINTAIVYMHRFYMYHTFTRFPRNSIAAAALFLAAKVEEQPHKLEHVIRVCHACLHRGEPPLDPRSNTYAAQAQELVINESIILQTLGFEVGVVHPHSHVVKCTQMIRASKDLSQSSYFLATNSLHLTTFCLKYKPTVVACVCIHLACKWTQWTIPKSNDGKGWWEYVDPTVTENLLDELTREFLAIIDRCPMRLKKRIMGYKHSGKDNKKPKQENQPSADGSQQQQPQTAGSSQGSVDSGVVATSSVDPFEYSFDAKSGFDQFSDSEDAKFEESSQKSDKTSRERSSGSSTSAAGPPKQEVVKVSFEEYKRKEKERKEREMQMKKQQPPPAMGRPEKSEVSGIVPGRPSHRDSKHYPDKLPGVPPGVGGKERGSQGHERYSTGHERIHPPHERTHTGHERIQASSHDRHASGHEKLLSNSDKIMPGNPKVHSGHTRGPSGPERLPSSHERSSSGQERIPASLGRAPSSSAKPTGPQIAHKVKSQDKALSSIASIDPAKRGLVGDHRDRREHRRPEANPPAPPEMTDEHPATSSARLLQSNVSDALGTGLKEKSYAHAVKGISDRNEKMHRRVKEEQHTLRGTDSSKYADKISKLPFIKKESIQAPKPDLTSNEGQIKLEIFQELSANLEKELEMESGLNVSDVPQLNSVPETVTIQPKTTVDNPPSSGKSLQAEQASLDKTHLRINKDLIEHVTQEENPHPLSRPEDCQDGQSSKRDHSERKEEREKRREGHKSKRDDRKHHRSHKHRNHSPSSRKHAHENDVSEAGGDMAPAKRQRLEETGSPHTVLTTSTGIKLKIKGLSNSFNNGSDERNGKDSNKTPNASCESPGQVSLKLNLKINSPHNSSPRESGRDKDQSNHHRSHHKHKSRHHRSRDGHHRHSRSPNVSGASDASPAISPSKRRALDVPEAFRASSQSSQSLLDLPMPPDPARLSSSHLSSPVNKHSRRKREPQPPLPREDVPPPPPPPPPPRYSPLSTVSELPPMLSTVSELPPMLSTIDHQGLFSDFQPPLPSGNPTDYRPPPPPPFPPYPPSQKKPRPPPM
ncbi:uncharacterized protein [Diadema setosum]|uniref:uncharacterized protein isoform X1 n=1 Tax=Diadema setosum TaxID=31175 RepID=UPI003B3A8676